MPVLPILAHKRIAHLVVIELFGGLFRLLRRRERLLCLGDGSRHLGGTHVDFGDLCVQQLFFTQHVGFLNDIGDGLGRDAADINSRLLLLILDTHIARQMHLILHDLLHFALAYILVRIRAFSHLGCLVDFITSTIHRLFRHGPLITCRKGIEFTLSHEQAVLFQLVTSLLVR